MVVSGVFGQPDSLLRWYGSRVRVPIWLTLGFAALVIFFGFYRIRLSFRNAEQEQRAKERGGLFGMARRTQLLIGIIYLLLGGALIATSFGWNPFGDFFGPRTEVPAKDRAPTKTVPLDHLPKK
jgi:hypothetical protein